MGTIHKYDYLTKHTPLGGNVSSYYMFLIPFVGEGMIYYWLTDIRILHQETTTCKGQRGPYYRKLDLFVGYHRRVNGDTHILSHMKAFHF